MRKSKTIDSPNWMCILVAAVLMVAGASLRVVMAQGESESTPTEPRSESLTGQRESRFQVQSLRGQVVWYEEALQEQLGIQTVPEARQRVLALATQDGKLIPIIEDLRGRAFRTDPRLREMEVELMVRRYEATPSVQILRVYQWKDDQKYQVDYWCDVCAIVMFEDGPCSCCQDHNRLRTRLVE